MLDLLTEKRNHRAGRSQDIAETHHGETGLVHLANATIAIQGRRSLSAQCLQHHFRQPLGAAHDIGRPHRLVGRDQHEIRHTRLDRRLRGIQGAQQIVQHPLGDVVLHHRHMLVGRRVINGIHLPGSQYILQPHRIANRAEYRHQLDIQRFANDAPLQLTVNAVEIEFGMLEQNQHPSPGRKNLPAQLRTNRAAGSCNQYRLLLDATLEQLSLRRYGIAPEQVGNINFLQIVDLDLATGQVHDPWYRTDMQRIGFEHSQHFTTTPARSRWNGQQHLARCGLIDQLLDVLGLVYLQPGDDPPGNGRIVIDKRHR
ncbi:hypothetical protein D9M68_597810 [compost metagenome]